MRIGSLFSGYGGLDMAVEQAAAAISHLLERVARGRVRGEMTPYYEDDAVTLRRRGGAK